MTDYGYSWDRGVIFHWIAQEMRETSRASLPLTTSHFQVSSCTPHRGSEPAGSGLGLTASCPASITSQMGSAHCPGQRHGALSAAGTELGLSVQWSCKALQCATWRRIYNTHAAGVAFCRALSGLCTALCICQSSFGSISLLEFHGPLWAVIICIFQEENEAPESDSPHTQTPSPGQRPGAWHLAGCSWGPFCHPGPAHPPMSTSHPTSSKKPSWIRPQGSLFRWTIESSLPLSVAWLFDHSLVYLTSQVCIYTLSKKIINKVSGMSFIIPAPFLPSPNKTQLRM